MKKHRAWLAVLIAAACLAALTGCSDLLGELTGGETDVTPTPTQGLPEEWQSTPSASIRLVASQACSLASWYTMRIDKPQGDLIAWSPDGARLAFLLRQPKNAWYVGDLVIASGADFQTLEEPTLTITAFGDLTWSPDGTQLAFVALRADDQTYTVAVYTPGKPIPEDLFPDDLVHTDQWSSPKGIASWVDDQRLLTCLKCGPGCEETSEVSLASGYRPAGAGVSGESDTLLGMAACLAPDPGAAPAEAGLFPEDASVSWSADGNYAAYIDRDGKLWIYQTRNHTAFLRETDTAAQEVKWSPDSQRLAIRTEDQVFVDQVDCR